MTARGALSTNQNYERSTEPPSLSDLLQCEYITYLRSQDLEESALLTYLLCPQLTHEFPSSFLNLSSPAPSTPPMPSPLYQPHNRSPSNPRYPKPIPKYRIPSLHVGFSSINFSDDYHNFILIPNRYIHPYSINYQIACLLNCRN